MADPLNPEVRVYPDLEALSRAATEETTRLAQRAVAERACCALFLSGGKTPKRLYQMLAEGREHLPWESVHLFWGDERCVPPDHPESNYAMAYEALISQVPLPAENVHRIPAELPAEEAAEAYERTLRAFFAGASAAPDLILLGLGADGHTASLFPKDSLLHERSRWVKASVAPAEYAIRRRVTVTLALLNRARQLFFLVAGADKRRAIQQILAKKRALLETYPAARVQPQERLVWFLDNGARGTMA